MQPISYARHQFPPEVIRHAIWLYLRFTLSYRDVEELLAERGLDISYETIRRWVIKFGPAIARNLRPFNLQRHLVSRRALRLFRSDAAEQWKHATAAA
jgi:transposase-like protein